MPETKILKTKLHPLQQEMVNNLYKHFCKECGKKDGHYIQCKEGTN